MKSMIFPPQKASYVEFIKAFRKNFKENFIEKDLNICKAHVVLLFSFVLLSHQVKFSYSSKSHRLSSLFPSDATCLDSHGWKGKSFLLTGNKRKKHPVHFPLIQNKTYICSDTCILLAVKLRTQQTCKLNRMKTSIWHGESKPPQSSHLPSDKTGDILEGLSLCWTQFLTLLNHLTDKKMTCRTALKQLHPTSALWMMKYLFTIHLFTMDGLLSASESWNSSHVACFQGQLTLYLFLTTLLRLNSGRGQAG